MKYNKTVLLLVAVLTITIVAISIGIIVNPSNTAGVFDVVDFSLKPLNRVSYGSLVYGDKQVNFNERDAQKMIEHLKEIKVNKAPLSKNIDLDRDATNQINFILRGITDNFETGNMYFNFNKDFSEVWIDNTIKPSFSYKVKNPKGVKNMFENQFEIFSQPMKIASAKELWKARTEFVGNNSSVANLIGLLRVPEEMRYDHFQLYTSKQPYEIEIIYSVSSETLAQYEEIESKYFSKNALILLALVKNADGVRTTITDGNREVTFSNNREWADTIMGEDIKNFSKSSEKLEELITFIREDSNV